jgi:hypothetical protein
MFAVKGIYDGITAKPSSKIAVNAGCPVIITFLDENCILIMLVLF